MSLSRVRWAVPRAHPLVDARPTSSTASPQPDTMAQPPWLAAVNPATSWPATIDPITATPRVAPTWRQVDAIEAATPDWAGGIPDTAVLEIGGLTNPKPIPNTMYTTTSTAIGVVA